MLRKKYFFMFSSPKIPISTITNLFLFVVMFILFLGKTIWVVSRSWFRFIYIISTLVILRKFWRKWNRNGILFFYITNIVLFFISYKINYDNLIYVNFYYNYKFDAVGNSHNQISHPNQNQYNINIFDI